MHKENRLVTILAYGFAKQKSQLAISRRVPTKYRGLFARCREANAGKQSVSYVAVDIWKDLPSSLKDLRVFVFSEVYKTLPPVRTKTEPIFHLAKFVN